MTFAQLVQRIDEVVATLRNHGLRSGDRVAALLPQHCDSLALVLGVTALTTCVPLNPTYRPREQDAHLSGLDIRAVIGTERPDGPNQYCEQHGIPFIEWQAQTTPTGNENRTHEWITTETPFPALILGTSGTTSTPKRVPLSHRNLSVAAENLGQVLHLDSGDRCLNLMPLFHIHGLMVSVSSLWAGGSIVIPGTLDVSRFREWLSEAKPTWYSAVPTMHQGIVDQVESDTPHSLRFIRSASAPLPAGLRRNLERVFAVPVIEAYGMTEATHQVTSQPLPPHTAKPGSVGVPNATEVGVVDEDGRFLEQGESGEIVIRGANVIQGYLGDSSINDAAFFGDWLRTGDEGRLDRDGHLFLTGRQKEMINRGGEKISPIEVEEVLLEHATVDEAAVFPLHDELYGEQVAAAIVLAPGAGVDEETLQAHVRSKLADFKVPRHVLFVTELPRGVTGKIQRMALAKTLAPSLQAPSPAGQPMPDESACNSTERALCELWCKVLRVSRVGADQSFVNLGGDSMRAAQLLRLVHESHGADIPLAAVFGAAATVRGMARMIDDIAPEHVPRPHRISRSDAIPLYHTQQQDWVQGQLQTEEIGLQRTLALRLTGELSLEVLNRSVTELVQRHEALRLTIHTVNGEPVQRVNPAPRIALEPEVCTDDLDVVIQTEATVPFELDGFPLFRLRLLRVAPLEHLLLLIAHQLTVDGASLDILHRDLASLYAAHATGESASLPDLTVSFSDHAAQSKTVHASLTSARDYWREQLGEYPPTLELPTDFLRPTEPVFRNRYLPFELEQAETDSLRQLARRGGATLFVALMTGFTALLYRYTQSRDLMVGTVSSGRMEHAMADTVGPMHNLLPIRVDLSDDPTFEALLERVRERVVGALANQALPFPEMLRSVRTERDGTPLVRALLILKQRATDHLAAGLRLTRIEVNEEHTPVDLSLELHQDEHTLRGSLSYLEDLFEADTAVRFLRALKSIYRQMIGNPRMRLSDLVLPADEQRLLSQLTTGEHGPVSSSTLHEQLSLSCLRTPDALAVCHQDMELSYRQLEQRANQIAGLLIEQGVSPGTRVGLFLDFHKDAIPALLGILKSGGAVVPLHWSYPPRTHLTTLREAAATHVVTDAEGADRLPAFGGTVLRLPSETKASPDPGVQVSPDDTAIVYFTSGSTGKPKGSAITHRALTTHSHIVSKLYELGERDRCLQFSSLSADLAMEEIFPTLFSGSTVVVRTLNMIESPSRFLELARSWDITVLDLQTRYWHEFAPLVVAKPDLMPERLRLVMVGGERPQPEQIREWMDAFGHRVRLLNCYGPTEATVMVTCADLATFERRKPIPIGRPLPGVRLLVVDSNLKVVPIGVPGELLIGGPKLASGYLNDPEQNRRHFIPDPAAPDERLFRTGDRVRMRPDGQLEFHGRLDDQVKIRGFRTEPAEVEAVLGSHPDVADALVTVATDNHGDATLHAYIVAKPDRDVSSSDVTRYMRQRLPFYQVPQGLKILDRFPLNRTGKIDRTALPVIEPQHELGEESDRSEDDIDRSVVAIVGEVLGTDVTLRDDFFALGGDSLKAMQVVSRIQQIYSPKFSLIELFDHSGLGALAERIRLLVDAC